MDQTQDSNHSNSPTPKPKNSSTPQNQKKKKRKYLERFDIPEHSTEGEGAEEQRARWRRAAGQAEASPSLAVAADSWPRLGRCRTDPHIADADYGGVRRGLLCFSRLRSFLSDLETVGSI
jgi:hypothetical protein